MHDRHADLSKASQATNDELATTAALEVCRDWLSRGECRRGAACPYRHSNSDKVCKHWLRDLCKKGDQCEFLHEYNLKKMPECHFFSTFGRPPMRRFPPAVAIAC